MNGREVAHEDSDSEGGGEEEMFPRFLTVQMILTDDFFIELADFDYFYR